MGTSTAGRLALAALFTVAPRPFLQMEIHGLERDASAPSTIYAISHKRDWDASAPLPALLRHRGWHALAGDLHFAMRADSFEPGFLSLVAPKPEWFARMVWPLSLAGILSGVGVHPLNGFHARPLHLWIRDWLTTEGDSLAATVLAPATLARLADAASQPEGSVAALPLSRLLHWRYHKALRMPVSADVFLPNGPRHHAEVRALVEIERELESIATWLRRGGSIYTSPEGRLSPDGRIGPILAALSRLARAGPAETRVQPIMIVYDFMTVGRPRMMMEVAPPVIHAAALTPRGLRGTLRSAWIRHARFTCTQLAAGIVVGATQRNAPITVQGLGVGVYEWARQLASEGRLVDERLLRPRGAEAAAAEWLRYAKRHHVVWGEGRNGWRLTVPLAQMIVPPGGTGYRTAPMRYALNELRDMLDLPDVAVA